MIQHNMAIPETAHRFRTGNHHCLRRLHGRARAVVHRVESPQRMCGASHAPIALELAAQLVPCQAHRSLRVVSIEGKEIGSAKFIRPLDELHAAHPSPRLREAQCIRHRHEASRHREHVVLANHTAECMAGHAARPHTIFRKGDHHVEPNEVPVGDSPSR